MRPLRSMLFVPAISQKFVDSAPTRGADAIILDLEDSIPTPRKAEARAALPDHIDALFARGQRVFVRLNSGAEASLDAMVAVRPGVVGVMLPKVQTSAELIEAHALLSAAERSNQLPHGSVRTIALLEHPHAMFEARAIACADPRLMGLGFGGEDYAAAMGLRPSPEALTLPAQIVAMAARGAGLLCIGLPGGISEIRDEGYLAALAAKARAIGFTGSVCIHPAQVPILNAAFLPAIEEVEWARAVVTGFEAGIAAGLGAVSVAGRMVDKPVYEQAKSLIEIWDSVNA